MSVYMTVYIILLCCVHIEYPFDVTSSCHHLQANALLFAISLTTTACANDQEEKSLVKAQADLHELKCRLASQGGLPRRPDDGKIDYSKDFFARPSYLSVSGQLDAETCVHFSCTAPFVFLHALN